MKRLMYLLCMSFVFSCDAEEAHDKAQVGEKKPVILLLHGPPRSGRDLLSVRVSNAFSLPHISTADLLLDYADDDTELGKKIRACLHQGEAITDALLLELIQDRIYDGNDCLKGFLLDGFPKTAQQAKELINTFEKKFTLLPVHIVSPDDWIVRYHKERLVCINCGRVYHMKKSPPKVEKTCDFCKASLRQRQDDDPEMLKKRTEGYMQSIEPILSYYKEQKLLIEIDGTKGMDEMFQRVKELILTSSSQVLPMKLGE